LRTVRRLHFALRIHAQHQSMLEGLKQSPAELQGPNLMGFIPCGFQMRGNLA
jgi:hypothetical protein